jgi:hypothetical protein
MDTIKFTLLIGIAAGIVALISLGFVVLANAGSRNVVLAAGTLAGATVLFAVQLWFELQPSTRSDYITSEFTIDRSKYSIGQWKYDRTNSTSFRWTSDVATSQWLSENNLVAFDGDRDRLTLDMIVFSILQYMVSEQPDWRVTRYNVLKGSFVKSSSYPIFPERTECTPLDINALRQILETGGNPFAQAPFPTMMFQSVYVCLPPDTDLTVMKDSVLIKNPFCTIRIKVDQASITSFGTFERYVRPTNGPFLPNGEPQYETRVTGINVAVNYSRFRAQHPKMEKYRKWADRLVDGLDEWFAVPSREFIQPSDRTDAVMRAAHP